MFDRREICPDGLVSQVREQLGVMLREAWAAGVPCRYGAFIHPRRRFGEDGFGVITLRGESLLLTRELLSALASLPAWLPKGRPVTVGPDPADTGLEPAPGEGNAAAAGTWTAAPAVRRIRVDARDAGAPLGETSDTEPVPGLVDSESERRAVTVLTETRPSGWPP
jgi:hypothetical protein